MTADESALRAGDDDLAWAAAVVAHAAWRTSPEVAADVVLGICALARWPEPMREARQLARELRAAAMRSRT